MRAMAGGMKPALRPEGKPQIAYVIEPRFSGGTSAAVAAELRSLASHAGIAVHGVRSRMFGKAEPAAHLADTLDDLGLGLEFDAPVIAADLVIVHNPSFLKFDESFRQRIIARDLVLVAHENFLRPGGGEGFDVGHCLHLLDAASLAQRKWIAPISEYNHETVTGWMKSGHDCTNAANTWRIKEEPWFNVCDFPQQKPSPAPADRRGRISRAGAEKFPPLDVLETCFPPHAQRNLILGADMLKGEAGLHPHWELHDFGTLDVAQFYAGIDFLVHFVSPVWRESFGRVLAEATAAGKLVLSDPQTAANFGPGIVGVSSDEVEQTIRYYLEHPKKYVSQVELAQDTLLRYSPERFVEFFQRFALARGGMGA